jgi:hypothetical protein
MLPHFTVLIFGFRNPSMNHTEYKNHYETIHIPLAKSYARTTWPLSHTRHYFDRNGPFGAASPKVDWDSMAVLTFGNASHAGAFQAALGTDAAHNAILTDEHIFMRPDSPQQVIIGTDTVITLP